MGKVKVGWKILESFVVVVDVVVVEVGQDGIPTA
jgi:hypothetical protein